MIPILQYAKSEFGRQWQGQLNDYYAYDYHFSGRWLEETETQNSEKLKYPLQVNVFELPVIMHTSFTFGEVPDDAASLITPSVEIWEDGEKRVNPQAMKMAGRMTDLLKTVLDENNMRAKLPNTSLNMQVYGGGVLGAFYAPERENDGELPLLLKNIEPEYFYPIWSHDDYDKLIRAIVSYPISQDQAKEIGYTDPITQPATYSEDWTREQYSITVDDTLLSVYDTPARGKPVANIIPYTYVPHPPRVGFYGRSLLHNKLGLAKEINARMVDVGDVVAAEAMNIPATRNVRQAEIKWIGKAKPVLDLGYQQGDRVPDIMYPPNRGVSAQTAGEYVRSLLDTARGEAYTPPVIFGMGSGSQRSAASLALEAIPLVAHIREERAALTAALQRLFKKVLLIAAAKGVGGITLKDAQQARIKINWYPMLPRDVLEEVTSIITRVQAKILSPETAIEKIGDVIDIEAELVKIRSWLDEQKPEPPAQSAFENVGRNGELGGIKSAEKPETTQENDSNE